MNLFGLNTHNGNTLHLLKGIIIPITMASLALSGCNPTESKDPVATGYSGTFANSKESGALFVSAAAKAAAKSSANQGSLETAGASSAPAYTGFLVLSAGDSVSMTGTLDGTVLSISGGGYSFTGSLVGGRITGTYTGPLGSGGFSIGSATAGATTEIYLGTYTSLAGKSPGRLNLAISGSTMWGVYIISSSGKSVSITGTISGSKITVDAEGKAGIAVGTKTGTTWSGTYNDGAGDNGTWTAALFQ